MWSGPTPRVTCSPAVLALLFHRCWSYLLAMPLSFWSKKNAPSALALAIFSSLYLSLPHAALCDAYAALPALRAHARLNYILLCFPP